jgi:hypothetical protein
MGQTREQIAEKLNISVGKLDKRMAKYRRKLEHGGWPMISKGRDGEQNRG